MKTTAYFLILLAGIGILASCDLLGDQEPKGPWQRFPAKNIFMVSGMIEYTDSEPMYYPQVVLAMASNSKKEQIPDPMPIPGLYFPDIGRQITYHMGVFQWKPTPVEDALVQIEGPLNFGINQTVTLLHEGFGVYGDVNSELNIQVGGRYALFIRRSDGTMHRDTTTIIPPVTFDMPDTTHIDVKLDTQYEDGAWYELFWATDTAAYEITNDIPNHKVSRNRVSLAFMLNDGYTLDSYLYSDREPYFIEFWSYKEYTAGYYIRNLYVLPNVNDNSIDPYYVAEDIVWTQVAQFDTNLSGYHQPAYNNVGSYSNLRKDGVTNENEPHHVAARNVYSAFSLDPLYDMTTITTYDAEGNHLPRRESKTIGVFGSRSTVYDKTIVVAHRDYDPTQLGWEKPFYWYEHYP